MKGDVSSSRSITSTIISQTESRSHDVFLLLVFRQPIPEHGDSYQESSFSIVESSSCSATLFSLPNAIGCGHFVNRWHFRALFLVVLLL